MKITFNQKEEDGVYSVSVEATLDKISFGNKFEMDINKNITLHDIEAQKCNLISSCIEDFIKRYDNEKARIHAHP